jgi:non-canonical purine NTP pyrophosphatase (RdgB/HAM1 family)
MLYFVTNNNNKFEEAKAILGKIKQYELDLPEIQELDARKIIGAKLKEAFKYKQGELIVEDTGLYLDCLGGLPGPLVRWFLETIGVQGLAELAIKSGNQAAQAKTIVGYASNKKEIKFFEGTVEGRIVKPRGDKDWHWGPIFEPDGHKQTFGEMEREEKNKISMRQSAFWKLKKYL